MKVFGRERGTGPKGRLADDEGSRAAGGGEEALSTKTSDSRRRRHRRHHHHYHRRRRRSPRSQTYRFFKEIRNVGKRNIYNNIIPLR